MANVVSFHHGPDATPFFVSGDGAIVDAAGRVPFHGILSRALLERAGLAGVTLPPWSEVGHQLDEAGGSDAPELQAWRSAARACRVLSFAQSASAARAYAERLASEPAARRVPELTRTPGELPDIVLWNVKEGHTSSVWHATFKSATASAECAINVARDPVAARELRRTSLTLRRIALTWPDANVAQVREIATVRVPALDDPVVVTSNDWVASARELHRLPRPEGGEGPLVAVERFVADESAPARICRICGRRLEAVEAMHVERDLAEFLARGARFGAQLDINHGDVVWDGRRAIVVAIR